MKIKKFWPRRGGGSPTLRFATAYFFMYIIKKDGGDNACVHPALKRQRSIYTDGEGMLAIGFG